MKFLVCASPMLPDGAVHRLTRNIIPKDLHPIRAVVSKLHKTKFLPFPTTSAQWSTHIVGPQKISITLRSLGISPKGP